ncbi:MAG: hypothetical protein GYA47_16430 [Desulfovibrio sp.]|nr:hypothetical protein [Desulfovibrio sp.]
MVFLAAVKLGVLLFLGIDALVPEAARQDGHMVVAAVMATPKALAQSPKPAEPKPAPAETPAPAPAEKPSGPPGVLDWQELNTRKEDLDRREQAIAELEAKLDQRVKELAALEANLKTMLDQAQKTKDEKLRHLIDVYTNMKPKQAAEVLETLDERIAVKILAGMKGRQAGEILTGVSAKKAATLSEALTRLQLPPETPGPDMAPGQ